MNKIFKVVWNRTIQSFVVTSELAKGRVKSSAEQNSTEVSAESGKNGIATVFRLTVISAALLGAGNSYAATAVRGKIEFDAVTSATAVSGATATGIGALSVGASANATANGAVAVGTSANATHNNSLAVGTNAKATQTHAVAMGADTSASSSHATAIGKSANAVSTDSTALGADSKANGTQATAVGKNALANNTGTTALGNSAQAFGIGSIALGQSSVSRGSNGVAIGVGSEASANAENAIAIGTNAVGKITESIAVGSSAQAQSANTIAIGRGAVASSPGVVTKTPGSRDVAASAIAIGLEANASSYGAISIGREAGLEIQNPTNATANNIAIGNTARVGDKTAKNVSQSIAIGSGNHRDTNTEGRPEGAWARGDQSIAIGGNVVANGNSSVAIGGDDLVAVTSTLYSGNASDQFVYYNADGSVRERYALAGKNLGTIYTKMSGDTISGYPTTLAGQGSVALGVQANAISDLSLAVGTRSQASSFGGVAVGTGAKATLLNSVALGTASKTDKEGRSYVQREIMGVTYTWAGGATTDAGDVVSVGSRGYERQIINVSPGDISATSTDAINGSQLYGVLNAIERVRYFSVKSEEGKTDGTKNWNNDGAKETNSIAIGPNAATSTGATGSISLGHNANVLGSSSVAVGPNATVTSRTVGAVALGSNANSRGTGSIAIGLNTENDRNYSIVVGAHSRANYENATVVGARAAAQNNGTAMGYLSNAVGDDSVAIGHQAQTTQAYSIAIGKQANSSGLYSTAIGSSAQAAGQNSFAGGNNAKATGSDSVALGNGATTTVGSSVALGNGAVGTANSFDATAKNASFKNDSGAATNVSYAASSSSKTGAVSVGSAGNERQIQNVAAGRISSTSTDAVNGSQLYTVMNNVGHNIQQNGTDKSRINNNGTVNYANGNLTTVAVTDGENASKVQINVTQGTLSVNNNGTVSAPTAGVATAGDVANAINNAKTTTNVAAGSNTHVNKTTSGKETTYTVSADKATVQVSNALNLNSNTTTAADGAVTTNYSIDLAQSTKDNIQKGVDAKTTVDTKGLTFNGDSGSTSVEKLGSTVTVAGDDNITTEAQDDKVTVKLKKDLVVNSVKAGDTTVNNDGVKVGDDVALTQDGVKAGDVKLTKDGLNNAGNKVTNVAAGTDDTDAVNYGQLKETNANVAKGLNIAADNGNDDNVQLGETVAYRSSDKNIVTTVSDNQIDFKLAKDITVDSVTAGNSKLNSDGLTITGGPSVTKSGIHAAGNKITNVAAGTDDNDAVNYSQLKQQSAAARTEVAAGTNIKDVVKGVGNKGQDVYTVNAKGTTASAGSSKVTVTAATADANNVTDYSIDLADGTKADIQKGVDAKTAVDSKGLTFSGDNGSTNIEKLGSTVTVTGDDNITTEARDDKVTVKLKKDLVVNSVEAGDTTVNNDGVKVGDDVALTQDGVKAGDVKLTKDGLNNAGKKVINVADGDLNANSKDAVNGSQLFATNQNVANNAANIAKGINFGGTTGSNNYALGDTINVKGDSNIISETVAGGAQLKLAKDITVDSVTAGDSKLNSDGLTITGGPSVTKSGINAAGNKITNVAAGTDDNDAVNYSQLKQQSAAARTEVRAGTNIKDVVKGVGNKGQDVYTVNAKGTTASAGSSKVTVTAAEKADNVTDYSIDLADGTKAEIQKGVDAKTAVDSKGLTFNGDNGSTNIEKLGSTVTVAGDDNITTEAQDDKVTVKLNKDLVVDSVKAGDTTVNNDGVKVGDDVALTQDGVKAGDVKLTKDGLNNAGKKVINVADGDLNANSKDAVNGSQLFATNQNVATNAANIAKGINFGGTAGSNNYALGDTINVKGDSNIISETVAGGAQLKLANVLNVGQAAPVKIDGDKGEVSGLSNTTLGGSDFAQGKRAATEEQLNAAQDQLVNVLGGNAANNGGNISMTDIGGTGENNIHDAIKAVNATANLPLTFGGDSGKDVERKPGTKLNIVGGQTDAAKLSDGNIGVVANGSDKLEVKLAKDLAVDSVKAGDTTVNTDGVKVGDVNLTKAGLNNGGNKITNVAAGTDDTDAVNVAQLNKASVAAKTEVVQGDNIVVTQDVGANGQTIYKVATDKNLKVDSVTAGDTVMNNDGVKVGDDVALNKDGLKAGKVNLTKDGLDNGGNKITNVAAGTDDTDAVNVSQLKQAAAASKTEVVQGKNIVVTQKTGDKGQTVYEVATDKDLDVDSVKAGDTAVNADGVKVGDDVALNKDGLKAGKVNLTKDGLDNAGNKVTNVADGDINANSKDAVNGSQLYATNQNVANNAATIAKGINFGGTTGNNNYALGDTINVKGDSNIISETVAGGAQLKLADEISVKTVNADTFKAGDTVMNNDGVKVGDKVALNKDGLTAGNTVVNNDGVTIAAPTENNPNNQVKLSPVGLNNGGQRITNVAPGKDGTDAANVNQLIGLGTELQNNINQVGKKAYAGVAGAIAQGSIPQVTRPGATGIGVGSGYYGGQSAMAIGVSAMSDGGNWIVKGNFSANTDGHVGVGAGALYQW